MADRELVRLLRDAAEMLNLIEWDEQTGEADNRRILNERNDLIRELIAKANEMEA